MKRYFLILLTLSATIILGACSQPTTSSLATPPLSPATPYVIAVIPTPSAPDTCTITGVLMRRPGPQPVKRTLLALATIIEVEGTPVMARINNQNVPRNLTDDNGRFAFVDMPADQYALVLDKITESFLLSHPTTGKDMLIACEAGQVVDLGELVYSDLPLPTPMK